MNIEIVAPSFILVAVTDENLVSRHAFRPLYELVLSLRSRSSVSNPLHVFEQNLLAPAVIEFRCAAIGVASDALSGFKGTVVLQKVRDTGRSK